MRTKIIYTAIRLDHKGKKTYYYKGLNSDEVHSFGSQLAGVNFIGGMVEGEWEGRSFMDIKAIPESHTNKGDLMAWEMKHRAALEEYNAMSKVIYGCRRKVENVVNIISRPE